MSILMLSSPGYVFKLCSITQKKKAALSALVGVQVLKRKEDEVCEWLTSVPISVPLSNAFRPFSAKT
jgi:hypothetical protein